MASESLGRLPPFTALATSIRWSLEPCKLLPTRICLDLAVAEKTTYIVNNRRFCYKSFMSFLPRSRKPFPFFSSKLQWLPQIPPGYLGDLAVAPKKSHQKSFTLCDSGKIYPSEPQQLVTHKSRRRNRKRQKVLARSQLKRSRYFNDRSSNNHSHLPSLIF